jgi:hypothetical protein
VSTRGGGDVREKQNLEIQATCINLLDLWLGEPFTIAYCVHDVGITRTRRWDQKCFDAFNAAADGGKAIPHGVKPLAFQVWDPYFRVLKNGEPHSRA